MRPNTNRNTLPRTLTLRFPAPCAECRRYIARGEVAFYDPETRRAWGDACGHAKPAAYYHGAEPPTPVYGVVSAARLKTQAESMASLPVGPRLVPSADASTATFDELDSIIATAEARA